MHRRWTDLDSVKSVLLSSSLTIQLHSTSKDEYRLPEGLRRVGYDADERRHYFRDRDGQAWRSEPGNEYGVLTPVRDEPPVTIPRRPPASSSSTPIDCPSPKEPTSTFGTFTEMLNRRRTTDVSSRSSFGRIPFLDLSRGNWSRSTAQKTSLQTAGPHTITIPSIAALKRSSTRAASFIRSRGKISIRSGHSKGQSHEDDNQRPSHTIDHRRVVSSPATIGRLATTISEGNMRSDIEPLGEDALTATGGGKAQPT